MERESEHREAQAALWKETSHRPESIPMNSEQIDKVKSAMAGFTLPTPPWAQNITDDAWKEKLVKHTKKDEPDDS